MLNLIEMLASGLASISTDNLEDYCALETVEITKNRQTRRNTLSHALVARDGSYVSLLKLNGSTKIVGENELSHMCDQLNVKLKQYLNVPGHSLQFFFIRDPDQAVNVVSSQLTRTRKIAKQRDLDFHDLLHSKQDFMCEKTAFEACYLALWTRPSVLSKLKLSEAKSKEDKKERLPAPTAQDLVRGYDHIYPQHNEYVVNCLKFFSSVGLSASALAPHESIRQIKKSVYPDQDVSTWKPSLPLDHHPVGGAPARHDTDISSIFWPKLSNQIFTDPAEEIDANTIQVGDNIFTSYDMTCAPERSMAFHDLVNSIRLSDNKMPWRISITLDHMPANYLSFKSLFAAILKITNSTNNGKIMDACDHIKNAHYDNVCPVMMRVSLATWAHKSQMETLTSRRNTLLSSFQSWGNPSLTNQAGDPLAGLMSSSLGLGNSSTATPAFPPLMDALKLLPIDRAGSPFHYGETLFKTEDNILYPFSTFSKEFESYLQLYFAPPGAGKSVLLNTVNLNYLLAPSDDVDISQLPHLSQIDVGDSAKGVVDTLKNALPKNRQHEVIFHTLQNTKDHAINMFDTKLGLRYPLSTDKDAIVRILTLLLETPDTGDLSGFVNALVTESYKHFANPRYSKPYNRNIVPKIDTVLDGFGYVANSATKWWDIVDFLFQKGDEVHASIAQRYAVPYLGDLPKIIHSTALKNTYGDQKNMSTGQGILDYVSTLISEALNAYPMLTRATEIDFSNARVKFIDMSAALPQGDTAAEKRGRSVMYLLVRQLLAADYFACGAATDGLLNNVPEPYKSYHQIRLNALRGVPKRIVYEEFHRTQGATPIRSQIEQDVRLCRKAGVSIALVSQNISDFNEMLIDFATAIFILRAGDENILNNLRSRFNLNEEAVNELRYNIKSPGQFVIRVKTKKGTFVQSLVNELSPIELWAMSSSAKDVTLRNLLGKKIGNFNSIKTLAHMFPSGSANDRFEGLQNEDNREQQNPYELIISDALAINKFLTS